MSLAKCLTGHAASSPSIRGFACVASGLSSASASVPAPCVTSVARTVKHRLTVGSCGVGVVVRSVGGSRAAARGFTSTAAVAAAREASKGTRGEPTSASKSSDLAEVQGEQFDEITDKWIPEKPVSVAEGAGYSVVIAAGLAVAVGAMWYSFKELILEPVEQSVFNAALAKIQIDPRVTVRIGTPMTGYGSDSRSRSARQRIAHTVVTDGRGVEHVRVQFNVRGPQGKATVHADAFRGESGEWEFAYVLVDTSRERVVVVQPRAAPSIMRSVPEGA